ncbi:hypothetical protein [Hyphomicrobium sp. DY-1]|uniref:hypothetical protein n=1 Tax=Hyphomicrobium sp. DY-1 TaxID=3075650 RepID=UPI0039C4C3B9
MKWLLAVAVAVVCSATVHAAIKSVSGRYLLLYPSSTIESDFSGACARVTNVGRALVYLPMQSAAAWDDVVRVAEKAGQLKAVGCGAR